MKLIPILLLTMLATTSALAAQAARSGRHWQAAGYRQGEQKLVAEAAAKRSAAKAVDAAGKKPAPVKKAAEDQAVPSKRRSGRPWR